MATGDLQTTNFPGYKMGINLNLNKQIVLFHLIINLLLQAVRERERERRRRRKKMPCLDISTNVSLDGVDTDSIFSEATKAVASIIGKPESYVMVLLKGSVAISFGGNKDPAAFAEVISMGGINSAVKKKLIATIGTILKDKLSVPQTRFFLKVYDTTAGRSNSKM